MRRRTALKLIAGTGAAAAAGGAAAILACAREASLPDRLVEEIRSSLSYLTLVDSDERIGDFVRQFLQRTGADGLPGRWRDLYRTLGGRPSGEVEQLVSTFLLSTDFFENGADEKRPVSLVAYFDPYENRCRNPLLDRS